MKSVFGDGHCGPVGLGVGWEVEGALLGAEVGNFDGKDVGLAVEGSAVGFPGITVGATLGWFVGLEEGISDGFDVGVEDGSHEGSRVGLAKGSHVGSTLG